MWTSFWPWAALAGAGALHGLSPLAGWGPCLAVGRAADLRRALAAMAAGQASAIALVALGVAGGVLDDLGALRHAALGAIVLFGVLQAWRRRARVANVAFGSFLGATWHGTGMMLVPALVPACAGAGPVRAIAATGSSVLVLAAVGVHVAATLGTAGLVVVATRGWRRRRDNRRHDVADPARAAPR